LLRTEEDLYDPEIGEDDDMFDDELDDDIYEEDDQLYDDDEEAEDFYEEDVRSPFLYPRTSNCTTNMYLYSYLYLNHCAL
jgi:hypothetical protein